MKSTTTFGVVCTVAVALLSFTAASSARAGFVYGTIGVDAHNPAANNPYDYSYAYYPGDGSADLDVYETWNDAHGSIYSFDVFGEIDQDPPLRIVKTVMNGTSFAWVGYKMDLDPADPHTFELASPAPTSDKFTWDSANSDFYHLEFGAPGRVEPGETVTFDFTVNVQLTGPTFRFTLSQMPVAVPEPAAGAVMLMATAVGAAFWRRRMGLARDRVSAQ